VEAVVPEAAEDAVAVPQRALPPRAVHNRPQPACWC